MDCDCQRSLFNCEERVRRYLGVEQPDGSMDLAARDELLEKMTPLVEQIVRGGLKYQWQQDREDVAQEAFLKLLNPAKLRTWLDNPKRAPFCHWASVVVAHIVIDWQRELPSIIVEEPADPSSSHTFSDVQERAEQLRKAIIAGLAEFEFEWQLVFCMKFSYLEPCISDIGLTVKRSKEAVFFRLRKIKESLARRCGSLLSSEVKELELVGTCHPVKGFDQFEGVRRDHINNFLRTMLTARPIKEQLAFYLKYSPLAASLDELATHVRESKDTVQGWLADIEMQIKQLCSLDEC